MRDASLAPSKTAFAYFGGAIMRPRTVYY